MPASSASARQISVTRRALPARSTAAWPAELAPPTTTTSSPSTSAASAGAAP